MKRIVMSGLAAAMLPMALCAGDSVWKDALLHIRGARDFNHNGFFNANPNNDNYASATVEIPDARRAAVANPNSARIWYAAATGTEASDHSNVRIVTNDVVSAAWGDATLPNQPCLRFPSENYVVNGVTYLYCQRYILFGGLGVIGGDEYTYLARVKLNGYTYPTGSYGTSWLFNGDAASGQRALRFGFRTESRDTTQVGWLDVCVGNATHNVFNDVAISNAVWAEVAFVVSGRTVRASCGMPGRIRRWQTKTFTNTTAMPSFKPAGTIYLGGCRSGQDSGNQDSFRGDIHMVGVWERALSDEEVVEAFGGPNPNLFRIGEQGCSQDLFAGAQTSGEVTLDQTVSDQRLWPAAVSPGMTLKIPFTVDKYRAGMGQVLRLLPREGSGMGVFEVGLDGKRIMDVQVRARAVGGAADPSFMFVERDLLTQGPHVLTLKLTDYGSTAVKLDVIELGGSWRAGLRDNAKGEVSSDGDSSGIAGADIWYAASQNMKDFVYYTGRSSSFYRQKRIIWRMPDGVAAKATYKIGYDRLWASGTSPHAIDLNGTELGRVENGTQRQDYTVLPGTLLDGLNEICCGYPAWTAGLGTVWVAYDSFWAEVTDCPSDKFPRGMTLLVR